MADPINQRSNGAAGSAPVGSAPISGGTKAVNVFTVDFTKTVGAITALVGVAVTQSIPGLLNTDAVSLQCLGSMTAGAAIGNVRVSSADTLEMTFVTAVAVGVTLGSLNWRVIVVR